MPEPTTTKALAKALHHANELSKAIDELGFGGQTVETLITCGTNVTVSDRLSRLMKHLVELTDANLQEVIKEAAVQDINVSEAAHISAIAQAMNESRNGAVTWN